MEDASMGGRILTVTVCQPGRDVLVADWPTLLDAKRFRDERLAWLARLGFRREHESGVLCVRMRRGLEVATVSIVGRDRA
jgi:hypothetical protein